MLLPDPGPLPPLRLLAFDSYQVRLPRVQRSAPTVIVAVDDESLARIGQWPWPRDTIARLVDRIAARQPAAIGIDLLFTEPDRSSPERVAEALREREPALAEQLSKLRSNDTILINALKRSPAVLGVAGIERARDTRPVRPLAPRPEAATPLQRYAGVLQSLPEIHGAARGHGLLNAEPERGIVRRVPLVAQVAGESLLTLALECFRVAAGVPPFTVSHKDGLARVQFGDLIVPAPADGKVWMHFARHDPSRYVSAADVLQGLDHPLQIEGKIALLGVAAQALFDQYTTPIGERMPGIEIHAQLVENIFDGALLTRAPWAIPVEACAFLLGAALLVSRVPRLRPSRSFALLLACSAVLLAAGFAAYAWGRMLFDPTVPIVGLTVVFGFMLLATLVATDLQRRELSTRLAAEREAAARVTGELEAARRIQMGMLPTRDAALKDERRIELFGYMRPAREVGGDLYDFFALPNDRFFVLIGDVSGKGLPAAMFMAVSKALAKSSALRSNTSAAAIVTAIDREIARENPEQNFVTVVALILDLKTGELEYCNAGHEPPLLSRRAGETVALSHAGGPPLCVIEDYEFEQARVRLGPGDILTLSSDGLTEAMNREGALYGRARLKALLDSPARQAANPAALGNFILAAVKEYEGGAEPADDQTLVLLSWGGPT